AEATRRLIRAAADRYADSTGRLENALRTAAAVRTATDDEAARLDTELAGRQQALGQVLARLDEAVAGALADPELRCRPGIGHNGGWR
ncbi:MAG TPA: hypothetical protein VG123_07565, partial [Streptosporangiaceae bacterium]|nr:hypothetical protein [Streptosporangiaceae bacterium]